MQDTTHSVPADISSALVWLRRDLRCDDHAALYHALRCHTRVYCVFVFDTDILDALPRRDRRVEFIHASVVALEYQRVQLVRPRPAAFGQGNGVRFDLTAQTKAGLDVKGTGVISEQGGKTYVLLYLAPAEHYFDATLAEVEAILGSAKLG